MLKFLKLSALFQPPSSSYSALLVDIIQCFQTRGQIVDKLRYLVHSSNYATLVSCCTGVKKRHFQRRFGAFRIRLETPKPLCLLGFWRFFLCLLDFREKWSTGDSKDRAAL